MSISKKIEDISEFIFKNYGIYENFPLKKKLLIHDNVFGTLTFTAYERKIINSPFLQRLTQITQMGLAYFVYPGAVHKRFSHSLGVSYISEKIYLQVIKSEKRSKRKIQRDINTLKLTGLLHDIGHGPFSHVTDDAYKYLSHFEDVPKRQIDDQISSHSGRNTHEFIGYHLCNSKLLKDLISDVYKCEFLDFDLIPLCITGNKTPSDERKFFDDKYKTLLIKIINGFSDADKIDYLLRDSAFSGLPIPADIDRLISFFQIIEHDETFELGVSEKGARAFNLLLQSKAKMFPTVYQHHTTLACEALLEFGIVNAIRNVKESTKNIDSEKWPYIECGLDLLYYSDISLLEYLRIIDNPISNDVVKRLNNRLHYRKIRQIYTWELIKELIKGKREYIKYLKEQESEREEIEKLRKEGDGFKLKLFFEIKHGEYKADFEEKIDKFYDDFDDYNKLHEFKSNILSKETNVLNKLKKEFPSVDEDTLIDYAICVKVAKAQPDKPYLQPYIHHYDKFKDKPVLLSLSQMGFLEPRILDYVHITFFALPKFVDSLKPHINDYLTQKLNL